MQFDEAAKLRKEWMDKGEPACQHPELEQRYLGQYAGDYACIVCGETFISPPLKVQSSEDKK
ncbi:hypothetical protein [Metabacillus endolithicus]|uniref:Uncharacterized protein n=1 Tax=Metabacillus endolithicus TaxID=1535204 RepID=A0ABW5BSR9_9BACI|nr:hypothetical protein [Metabacillus endolithicus]UPG62999.1 hypothetical protein MVE64_21945 [Metabacillus endolithicus]